MEKETVLVVDDNPDLVKILSLFLSPDYRVVKAYDGRQGLECAQTCHPDLILLDMNMPRMNGIEMLRALRETDCRAPVIFITAVGSEYVAVQAFKLGVHDYLVKPFSRKIIRDAVDHALHETRLAREKERLAKQLAAAETVRQTVATLAHHINNQLMVIHGNLDLLQEAAQQMTCDDVAASPPEIIAEAQTSVFHINAVLRILQRVTSVELAAYHDSEQIIDIEAVLQKELCA